MWLLNISSLYKGFFLKPSRRGWHFWMTVQVRSAGLEMFRTSLIVCPHPSQASHGSTPFSSLIFPPPSLPPPRATGLFHLYAFAFTPPPAFPFSAPGKFISAFQAQAHVTITSENPFTVKNPFQIHVIHFKSYTFSCPDLLIAAVTMLE